MSYGPIALDHFNRPRNVGVIENPTAVGSQGRPGQGNYMVVQIRVAGGRIVEAAFQTYGCPGAIACGSAVTELVKGKTPAEAALVGRDEVEAYLGGLPLGKGHCADLAAGALKDALAKLGA